MKERIRQIIFETTNIDPSTIADDASFVDDLDLDSLTLMEIAVNVDQEYDLDFPEEDMARLTDVNTSADLVMEFLAKKAAV